MKNQKLIERNMKKKTDWHLGYKCTKCNAMFGQPGKPFKDHISMTFCPGCGEFTKDRRIIYRFIFDSVWYKPWTWGKYHEEFKEG